MSDGIAKVIVIGNPVDGIRLYGPYADAQGEDFEDNEVFGDQEWWIADLLMPPTPDGRWWSDLIQFARLIAEADVSGLFTNPDVNDVGQSATDVLAEAMDVTPEMLTELIGRATDLFDRTKELLP